MRYPALAMHECQAVPAVQMEIIRHNELGFELLMVVGLLEFIKSMKQHL